MEIAIIPRFIIRKIYYDDLKQIHANVLFSSILIILVLLSLRTYSSHLTSIPHFCLFQELFHVPCPGCGITRSVFSIARGEYFLAWQYNPAGIGLFSFLLAQIPMRIIALKYGNRTELVSKISRKWSLFVIFSLILVWMLKLVH